MIARAVSAASGAGRRRQPARRGLEPIPTRSPDVVACRAPKHRAPKHRALKHRARNAAVWSLDDFPTPISHGGDYSPQAPAMSSVLERSDPPVATATYQHHEPDTFGSGSVHCVGDPERCETFRSVRRCPAVAWLAKGEAAPSQGRVPSPDAPAPMSKGRFARRTVERRRTRSVSVRRFRCSAHLLSAVVQGDSALVNAGCSNTRDCSSALGL